LQTQLTVTYASVQLSEDPHRALFPKARGGLPAPKDLHYPPKTFGYALAFVGPIVQKTNNLLLTAVVSQLTHKVENMLVLSYSPLIIHADSL